MGERGSDGATDEEVQEGLGLTGNAQRPRRNELWQEGKVRRTGGTRPTRAEKQANVWVAVPPEEWEAAAQQAQQEGEDPRTEAHKGVAARLHKVIDRLCAADCEGLLTLILAGGGTITLTPFPTELRVQDEPPVVNAEPEAAPDIDDDPLMPPEPL